MILRISKVTLNFGHLSIFETVIDYGDIKLLMHFGIMIWLQIYGGQGVKHEVEKIVPLGNGTIRMYTLE